jgi:putative ABC transport system substrate-binding protein
MRRRTFLCGSAAALARPLVARAQQPAKTARIGYLSLESASSPYLAAFKEGLGRLGYVDGRSIAIEIRSAAGNTERLATLANELVALKLEAIVGVDGPSARALSTATKAIPVVMGVSGDPVELGLAASLARPGGNVTGISFLSPELAGKRLQFLREISPKATRVAVLFNRVHSGEEQEWRAAEIAAPSLGLTLRFVQAPPTQLDDTFAAIVREGADAMVVTAGPITFPNRKWIAELAIKNRLPMVGGWSEYAEAGSLLSYGPNRRQAVRHLAYFIDRILKGAKPADLPVERPTRLELVVNLQTAKALGITMPASLLLQADQVID